MIKSFLKNHSIHKVIASKLDMFFILRPSLYFAVWVMVLVGMFLARLNNEMDVVWINIFNLRTFVVFFGFTCISSSCFILNLLSDKDSDALNSKNLVIRLKDIKEEKVLQVQKILLGVGVSSLVLANWYLSLFGVLLYIFWGIFYSSGKFHWKKKIFHGIVSNLIAGLMFLLSGYLVVLSDFSLLKSFNIKMFFISILPYLFFYISISLMTMIPDIEGDISTGSRTFPIVYGEKITSFVSFVLIGLGTLIGFFNQDPVSSTAGMISIPFYFYAIFRHLNKDIIRAIRYPIFLLNFFICVVYPMASIFLIINFYLCKYYYWHRFDLHYPTFLVDDD